MSERPAFTANWERLLFRAYGVSLAPDPRTCICGGRIAPTIDTEAGVASAILDHNRTDRHRRWQLGRAR